MGGGGRIVDSSLIQGWQEKEMIQVLANVWLSSKIRDEEG